MKRKTKKRLFLLAALAVIGSLGLGGAHLFRQHQKAVLLEESLAEGMAAYENEDYGEAVENLSYFVGRDKSNDEALLAFADSLRRTPDPNGKRLALAIRTLRIIVDRSEGITEAHNELLDAYARAGQSSEVVDLTGEMLEAEPDHKRATLVRAQALGSLARDDEAIEVASRYARENPSDIDGLLVYLNVLRAADRPRAEILDAARAAAERQDAGALVRLSAAGVLAENGRLAEAAEIVRDAASEPSSLSGRALRTAITVAYRLSIDDAETTALAGDLLAFAASEDAPAEARRFAAGWLYRRGDLQNTVATLEDLGKASETTTPASLGLLQLARQELGDADQQQAAERSMTEASAPMTEEDDEASAWSDLVAAHAAVREGDIVSARRMFAGVSERASGLPTEIADFFLAQILLRVGEQTKAEEALARLARDPAWRRARYVLSGRYLQQGDYAGAIRLLIIEPTLTTWPAGVERLTRAAIAQAESEEAGEVNRQFALELTDEYLSVLGRSPLALFLRSRALLASGNEARGLATARELIESGELNALGSEALVLARRIEPYDKELAADIQSRLQEASGTAAAALVERIREAVGREGARSGLRVLESAPEQQRAQLDLLRASLLDDAGDPQAAAELARIAEENPSNADAQLAILRSRAGWENLEAIDDAVQRLKRLTGPEGIRWRVADGRLRLLRDDSEATASDVLLGLETVLATEPDNIRALVLASDAARRLGDIAESADYLERARIADPDRVSIYPPLIARLQQTGRSETANDRLRDFAQLTVGNTQLLRQRAEMLEASGMLEAARDDRERLADVGERRDRIELARLMIRLGDDSEAERILQALASDAQTLEPRERVAIAAALGQLGKVDRGLAMLEELPPSSELGDKAIVVADFLLGLGRTEAAIERLRAMVQSSPSNESAWTRLIRILALSGRVDQAARVAGDAAQAVPNSEVLQTVADAFSADDDAETGLRRYAALIYASGGDRAGLSEEFRSLVGSYLRGERAREELASGLTEYVLSGPKQYLPYRMLVELRLAGGDADGALSVYDDAVSVLDGDPRPAQDAAMLLLSLARYEQAARMARLWAQRDPRAEQEAQLAEATALAGTGESSRALALFDPQRERLVDNPRRFAGELIAYAGALASLERVESLRNLIASRTTETPIWAAAALEAAGKLPASSASLARELLHAAAEQLDATRAGRSQLVNAWYQLALRTGESSDLRSMFDVSGFDPANPGSEAASTWAVIGTAYQSLGRSGLAEQALRAALTVDPDQPDALNNLGYLLVTEDRDLEEAADLASRAVNLGRQRNTNPQTLREYFDTLGLAYLKLGRSGDAEAAFREGLSLDPSASHLAVGLAEALVAGERFEEASSIIADMPDTLPKSVASRVQDVRARLR